MIQSIKKEYQRVINENNHLKKGNEQLEQYIIKEERKKQKKKDRKKNILKVVAAKMNINVIVKNFQSKEKINKNIMTMNITMTKIIATVQG